MKYVGLIGLVAQAGCGLTEVPGAVTYRETCVVCHGVEGRGDGPIAAELPRAPADLTGISARNGGVFPRDRVFEKIHGYPGRYQSDVMPEFGGLLEGPVVLVRSEDGTMVPTPKALVDLVAYLESIQES